MKLRYEVQRISDGKQFGSHVNFRITDTTTDSRIGTCYSRENADLIVRALNAFQQTLHCNICGGTVDLNGATEPTADWAGGRGKRAR